MKRFTNAKMILLSFFLLLLTACNNNNDNAHEAQNSDNDRSVGVQQLNNGYITNEHEPYRTSTSSEKYPQTTSIQSDQGQRKQFKFIQKKIVIQRPGQIGIPNNTQQQTGQPPQQNVTPGGNPPPPAEKQPTAPQQTEQQKAPTQNQGATGISQVENKVIELTNAERKKNGLPALKADTSLSNVARTKSNDMQQKNYFSHTSPTYGSPFDMMRDMGVTYNTAGENIAKGQPSAEQVVNAWMNSAGHRKNILSANFTHIGVGHTQNGNYWTQMFIGK